MIGVGRHAVIRNLPEFPDLDDCRVLAVCDVDANRNEAAANTANEKYGIKNVSPYQDFRELLLRRDSDAVMISTPDH